MDQLNRAAADDGGTDAASKVSEEGKGVKDNVDVASDGSPRRFYHTVRVCSVTKAILYVLVKRLQILNRLIHTGRAKRAPRGGH